MKKILAFTLAIVMMLGLCACSINKNEVSVLWSGESNAATDPNGLINAMERALYIENISYAHYAAGGDQAKQTQQAQAAIDAGCAALLVELVDSSGAQSIVDMAKAKNVPVVFFGCDVDEAIVNSYDKCVLVSTNEEKLVEGYSAMIYSYFSDAVKKQKEAKEKGKEQDGPDKDGDGNITYLALSDIAIAKPDISKGNAYGLSEKLYLDFQFVPVAGTLADLKVETITKEETVFFFFKQTVEEGRLVTVDGKIVEAIVADDDQQTLETLVELQKLGFNADKLTTHFVPVFTVGADADYKAYVMQSLPDDATARKEHLESVRQLVDMTTIEQKDWEKWEKKEENGVDLFIFNTLNQVSAGKLGGTTVENYDALAIAVAEAAANMIKGKGVEKNIVEILYTFNISK